MLVSRVITDVTSVGLTIHGIGTWVAASVIVWAAASLTTFMLPLLGLKNDLGDR
jgi:hypothetical protein